MKTLRFILPAAALFFAKPGSAQIRASELGVVQQTVDGTKITIEYSRPAARGRTLFGGVVHWGERWTPGANWATTLDVDHDIFLSGSPVPKGKYALWVVPRENADWTLIVHKKARAYHTQRPDSANVLVRLPIKINQAPHRERLTFEFPVITAEGGVIQFHWGTTSFDVPFRVNPSKPVVVDAATREQLVGVYSFIWRGRSVRMDVFSEGDKLRSRMEPMILPFDATFDLMPLSKNRFGPFFYKSGQPFDLEDFVVFFDANDGPATAVEWRGISDAVLTRGNRVAR